MEQFSLNKWLKDKSRKVVTRDGRNVRIICTDRKTSDRQNIIGLAQNPYNVEQLLVSKTDGSDVYKQKENDLFFADEEEELTEFEKKLVDLVSGWCDSHVETPEEYISKHSRKLLDLARIQLKQEMTEIQLEDTKAYQEGVKEGRRLERQDIDKELDEAYESRDAVVYLEGYDQGKEDTLKNLPKWKKNDSEFNGGVFYRNNEPCFIYRSYYISLDELFENLPKEE